MAKLSEIVRTNGKCLKCGRPSGAYVLCGICYYDKKMQETRDRRDRDTDYYSRLNEAT